jgi:hypothetical protein
MKFLWTSALSALFLISCCLAADDDKKRLQIGIKKKVENCQRTSKVIKNFEKLFKGIHKVLLNILIQI